MTVTVKICCEIIFAIIFPPIAVFLDRGCGCQLALNIVLTICGWFPGMIHAFFVILGGEEYDREMREEIRKKKEAEKKGKGEEKAPKESEEKDAAGTAASQPVQEKDQPEMKDTPKATSEPTVEEKKALVVTVEKPKDAPLS